jgi:hypothetical protein
MVVIVVMADGISARFGIELGVDCFDAAAQMLNHVCDNPIGASAQTPVDHLHWEMSIGEMPSNAQQCHIILRADFEKRFGLCCNKHNAAALQSQLVAVAESSSFRQIEQNLGTRFCMQRNAAAMAMVVVEQHGV